MEQRKEQFKNKLEERKQEFEKTKSKSKNKSTIGEKGKTIKTAKGLEIQDGLGIINI